MDTHHAGRTAIFSIGRNQSCPVTASAKRRREMSLRDVAAHASSVILLQRNNNEFQSADLHTPPFEQCLALQHKASS